MKALQSSRLKLRSVQPQTRGELKAYVKAFFGFRVPDKQVCADHQTPADFLQAMFFDTDPLILGIANRKGYKTLIVAIMDVLDMWFKGAGVIHAAAIEEQAIKGYGYVQHFLSTRYRDGVDGDITMSKTKMLTGGHIEVAPMTMNRMAGPHEPKLRRDETDLARQNALEQSKGIVTGQPGIKAGVVDISTRYHAHGNIQRMIEEAEETGRRTFMWCFKETTERCPDERSGTQRVTAWIDREALHAATVDEHKGYSEGEKERYEAHEVYDGCLKCKLLPTCCGDLKRADGNHSIEDMLIQYADTSAETWIAQMECKKPLSLGVVFKVEWKPRYHVRTERWKVDPEDVRHGRVFFWRCLDFGLIRPSVGWIANYPGKDLDVQFHELELGDITIDELKREIRRVDEHYGLEASDFEATVCDPAGKQRNMIDKATLLQKLGKDNPADRYNCKPVIPPPMGVWEGIEVVKSRLKVFAGRPRFQVVRETCPETIKGFESYRKKQHTDGYYLQQVEDPQEFEHEMDRIRYYMVYRYSGIQRGGRMR